MRFYKEYGNKNTDHGWGGFYRISFSRKLAWFGAWGFYHWQPVDRQAFQHWKNPGSQKTSLGCRYHIDGPGFEHMQRRCPSIKKINKLIGFKPSYDLEAMIQSVIDYFKEWVTKKMAVQSRKSNPLMTIDYQNPVKIQVSDTKLHFIQRAGGIKRWEGTESLLYV